MVEHRLRIGLVQSGPEGRVCLTRLLVASVNAPYPQGQHLPLPAHPTPGNAPTPPHLLHPLCPLSISSLPALMKEGGSGRLIQEERGDRNSLRSSHNDNQHALLSKRITEV